MPAISKEHFVFLAFELPFVELITSPTDSCSLPVQSAHPGQTGQVAQMGQMGQAGQTGQAGYA